MSAVIRALPDDGRATGDAASDGTIRLDADGRIAEFDEAAASLFGCSAADVLGRPATELLVRVARRARDDAAASRTQAELLAAISHQIRAAMNGILGASELLLDTRLDADALDLVTMVQANARGLVSTLDAFLDGAKIRGGYLQIDDVAYDPRDVLDDVVDTIAPAACAKQLELVTSVDPAVPHRLRGDPRRLRQILINIGDNAVKFTARGEVTIHGDLLSRGADLDSRELHFAVRDTGIGISHEDHARIFEPFAQLSGGGQHAAGTGLGLGIARSLVGLMGGRIELESEPGEGSTFHIFLPLRPGEPADLADVQHNRFGGLPVVVVAHPGSLRTMMASVLENAGCEVLLAATAEEGLDLVETVSERDPVVVIDDQVADFPPIESLPKKVAQRTGAHPHVVVLCMRDASGCTSRSLAAGMRCLRRPVRPRALVKAVHRVGPRRKRGMATRASILVADDSADSRALFKRALHDEPVEVFLVNNGREAVEAFARRPFSVVILDVDMPVMNGFDAARAIREIGRGAAVPIIALTGHAGHDVEVACRAAGFTTHLEKPVSRARLLEAIADVLVPIERDVTPIAIQPHLADLIPGFLTNRAADAHRILALLEAGELSEIRRLGHNLKASGPGYGFADIGTIGADLERAADAADHDAIRALARKLERQVANANWRVDQTPKA